MTTLPVWMCHWKVQSTALRAAICLMDEAGEVVREAKAASEPGAIVDYLLGAGLPIRAGRAGGLSLVPAALQRAGPNTGRRSVPAFTKLCFGRLETLI